MSWLDDMDDLSDAMSEEFALSAVYTPQTARPNQRAGVDPDRAEVELIGIFHENARFAGDNNRKSDGLRESKISSTVISFSINRECLPYDPKSGDKLHIPDICRSFRVRDAEYELPGRTKLVLEEMELPRLA